MKTNIQTIALLITGILFLFIPVFLIVFIWTVDILALKLVATFAISGVTTSFITVVILD